jgi:anaerobic selenocysteine-containing dehydrogenase
MSTERNPRVVYVAHPASGLARSNFPVVCHVVDGEIVRCLPFHIPESVRLYEIRTSRGSFMRSRKEVQMPLAYAWKRRVRSSTRVTDPLLRADWSERDPKPEGRGRSGYVRVSWDRALDVIVGQLERLRATYGTMEPMLVLADGHGQSGYLQSLHFWGHYLFDKIRERLGWGWWTQAVRNPDSWEGYYWGAKHVWGFDETLGEPYQDAVWDDVLQHAELVIFSGNDPEATGLGMSGSIALEMPKWLKRAGIKIIAISPDLNHGAAVHADKWIPVKPNSDAALYLALAHVWIAEGLYDQEYVETHTVGFEAFAHHVMGKDDGVAKTPEWAEGITGVPRHTIRALAREWARKKTTLSVYFGGPKIRGTLSHLAARLEAYVMAMQGIGKPGRQFLRTGAPSFYKKALAQVPRYPDVDRRGAPFSPIIEYAIGRGPKSPVFVPRTLAAEAILSPGVRWRGSTAALAETEDQFREYRFPPTEPHPGIRMVWNENGSQVGSWGHGAKWLEALRSPQMDFVVGIHPWRENDIMYSDLILPAQSTFEHEDLIVVQRSDLIAMFYQDQAIEPVGESKSDYEIHRLIAERLGLGDTFPPPDDALRAAYEGTLAFTKFGTTWEAFKQRKFVIYDCPTWGEWVDIKKEYGYGPHNGSLHLFWERAGGLQTPTGKIEFESRGIATHDPADRERPPLARWVTHAESQSSARARTHPLLVVTNHPRLRFHVQGDDIDWIKEVGKVAGADGYLYEPCWMHARDATPRGIGKGDIVMMHNERGAVLFGAVITERISPGAVLVEHGAKLDLVRLEDRVVDRGGCINLIAPSPAEKYASRESIKIPEMNVSGFLVEVARMEPAELASLTDVLDHDDPE